MNFIKRAWKGEEKLWKVFWLLGYGIPVLLAVSIMGLAFSVGNGELTIERVKPMLFHVMSFYYVVWVICVFKCAKNVNEASWGIAAKLWSVLVLARVVIEIINQLNVMEQVK